jgi:hypothetical protein
MRGFGPPLHVTATSTWPCLDHPVSGLIPHTMRPIQTRFPCAYTSRLKLACKTNSLTHYTKGTPSHHKGAPTACRRPVSGLFHSPLGVLFTFPSRYLFTIGQSGVFRLGGWSPHVQTGFLVSRPTRRPHLFLPIRDYHPLWFSFPSDSSY